MLNHNDATGESTPECWLYHQASFLLNPYYAEEDVEIGTNLDFFVLPPLDPAQATPMTGGVSFVSALVDRPEVRAFMAFVASPEWGERVGRELAEWLRLAQPSIRFVGLRRRQRSSGRRPSADFGAGPIGVAGRCVQVGRFGRHAE